MLKWIENNIELFDIVDKKDNIIKVWLNEKELHLNNDITRVVTTYIFDKNWYFYIAQRSPKKIIDPLKYEAPSHWRVNSWESYEIASKRETIEELWVKLTKSEEVSHYYTSFNTNIWLRQHYKKLFVWYIEDSINFCTKEIYNIKKFNNINDFFNFYKNNIELFSDAIKYDIEYLEKYYLKENDNL